MSVESSIVLLLLVLIFLLWQSLKWLKLIALSLGCNPRRSEGIHRLQKQLDRKNLTDLEKEKLSEELDELHDHEMFAVPCKAGQGIRIIERLQDIIKLLEAKV